MNCQLLPKVALAALTLATAVNSRSQNRIGDFIESQSYNDAKRGAARTMQYRPEADAFVSVNGTNRFTRALYGSKEDTRLETSDRPIFAFYKKNFHRAVYFTLTTADGRTLRLDSTTLCRAAYSAGRRVYDLQDDSWAGGRLRLTAVASRYSQRSFFLFEAGDMGSRVSLTAHICNITQPKLHRSGDIGADKPGVFEPAPGQKPVAEQTFTLDGTGAAASHLFAMDAHEADLTTPADSLREEYDRSLAYFDGLNSRIRFSTPDPYINALGGALAAAADGDWDGQTWLHGCVGWRMPLAGWRAGFLGDALGWRDRARTHFEAYAKSLVTQVPPTQPHPCQDKKLRSARAEERWGNQFYSNGYICSKPETTVKMNHYDMNLNYVDELLWHFCYDADTTEMRRMWPLLVSHLEWERRNFDPDGDHLYDAYCCIWASDALYYNGGAATHSTAYNYRGNALTARIASLIGEDPEPYRREAEAIRQAMDSVLWLKDKGHWAECKDLMGLGRVHDAAALWSVYTPIDCGACTPEQAYSATRYTDDNIPHIPVRIDGHDYGHTLSTSSWMPYSWSINNVAPAEVMHTALAYYEAGRAEAAFKILKANVIDQMYAGQCPGNFGQISHYDAARGECYRDFGDCIGISARTLLQGLFGIVPDALYGRCTIRPAFPAAWDTAAVSTPYLSYTYKKAKGKLRLDVTQHFTRPLQIVFRVNLGKGCHTDIKGTDEARQTFTIDIPDAAPDDTLLADYHHVVDPRQYGLGEPDLTQKFRPVKISRAFNANVADIFTDQYFTPRPARTTLAIPTTGIGEWCHPLLTAEISDSVFRSKTVRGRFTVAGVPMLTPERGKNIIYTSLFDAYPDSITLPLKGRASAAYLLLAGSTNHMQSRIDNALVQITYADGTSDTLSLRNPDNWCPIEQDYYADGQAFYTTHPRPIRVCFGTGEVSRDLGATLRKKTEVYGRELKGGAGEMLKMELDCRKPLRSLTLRTLSNDVVVGLMAVTLEIRN